MKRTALFAVLCVCCLAQVAVAQANGKLQIHFMNVGQGDGAVLISPLGEVVLFDNGVNNQCDKPVSYLTQLGVTKIDYQIVSHYHSDHIGCTAQVFNKFPLQKQSFDRGGSYNSGVFNVYVQTVGAKRTTATPNMTITLDATSPNPVQIKMVAVNGDGIQTDNENDLSLIASVKFGAFDALIGGDLSGFKTENYADIESSVATKVTQVEVYKVHHHGSRYSSNKTWLTAIKPRIGIVSAGNGNTYGHPTEECLDRLHAAGVKTYWTSFGNGVPPDPAYDVVGGDIIVESAPSSSTFTVTYHGGAEPDTYSNWESPQPPQPPIATQPAFSWSKNSAIYHFSTCKVVKNIKEANLQTGNTPPAGKTLHQQCPQ
jgi:beta-lactamase superfamily II metal-dependent hydrolase